MPHSTNSPPPPRPSGSQWDIVRGGPRANFTWYSARLDGYIQLRAVDGIRLPDHFVAQALRDLQNMISQNPRAAQAINEPRPAGPLERIYGHYLGRPVVYTFDVYPPSHAGANRRIIRALTSSPYSPFHSLMCELDRAIQNALVLDHREAQRNNGTGQQDSDSDTTQPWTNLENLLMQENFRHKVEQFVHMLDNSPYVRYIHARGQIVDVTNISGPMIAELKAKLIEFGFQVAPPPAPPRNVGGSNDNNESPQLPAWDTVVDGPIIEYQYENVGHSVVLAPYWPDLEPGE
ncbi:hypothetical protein B7463_g9763, partial [Scytalidium lignicola]